MGIVDFHTHILPGVDDGSRSVEQSLSMLRMEAEQGIRHVVLTPHFYANHDSPKRFLSKRKEAYEELLAATSEEQGLPSLSLGAEVHFFEGMSDSEFLQELAISGTKCVLVEMPMPPWSDRMLNELTEIRQKQGLIPIVAHIDRYIRPFRLHGIPERLAELPVLVQANGSFFNHRTTQRLAIKLLREQKIHLLGSDCHNLETRPPNLDGAQRIIERHLGTEALHQIYSIERELI